jgi:hypothetical protein
MTCSSPTLFEKRKVIIIVSTNHTLDLVLVCAVSMHKLIEKLEKLHVQGPVCFILQIVDRSLLSVIICQFLFRKKYSFVEIL